MKGKLFSGLLGLMLLLAALPAFAQKRTPIVISKNAVDNGVAVTANGNLWTAATYVGNYGAALVSLRKSGAVSACTLTFYTGQTAATATSALDDANNNFSCATAINKVVNNIDQYLQGTVTSWSGTGTITVYVTLINGVGWNLNATLSAVTQSTGAGDRSSLWRTQPGYDATGFLDVEAGVGVKGDGVQQVASVHAVSPAVASGTRTEVVAAPGSGSIFLAGLEIGTATNNTGSVIITQGTGTNCVTSPIVLHTFTASASGPQLPLGVIPLGEIVPAQKALCLTTDAATTSARVRTQ